MKMLYQIRIGKNSANLEMFSLIPAFLIRWGKLTTYPQDYSNKTLF